jgi:hypothetical protein
MEPAARSQRPEGSDEKPKVCNGTQHKRLTAGTIQSNHLVDQSAISGQHGQQEALKAPDGPFSENIPLSSPPQQPPPARPSSPRENSSPDPPSTDSSSAPSSTGYAISDAVSLKGDCVSNKEIDDDEWLSEGEWVTDDNS